MRFNKPIVCAKRLAPILIAILIAGCQTTDIAGLKRMATANTLAFCDAAHPLYWSRKDTLETIKQIKMHNAVGKICGWGK